MPICKNNDLPRRLPGKKYRVRASTSKTRLASPQMMSDNQPKRPPRMSRSMSKESSTGLLMSVIRSLTASRDVDERDREKANLERDFKESDTRLDQLIVDHHSDLTAVMNAFSKVSSKLKSSKERCKGMKDNLVTCKDMLRCKKDELRKLWKESVENRHYLELLNEVENVTRVPDEVTELTEKKKYLHATQLLVESVASLESNLLHVEALREVKAGLIARKDQMYHFLIDELHKHIYTRSTANILKKFKRTPSERRKDAITPSRKVSVADILSPALYQNTGQPRRRSPNFSSQNDIADEIQDEMNEADPESDSKHFIGVIIECLFLLKKIPDAIECIKDRAERELVNIVKRTARELLGGSLQNNTPQNNININSVSISVCLRCSLVLEDENNRAFYLQELCELLFQQFRLVVSVHENIVLPYLKKADAKCEHRDETVNFYSPADIWSKIQAVLQMITDLYLDISGANAMEKSMAAASQDNKMLAHSTTSVADLNSYFVRKRPALSVAVGGTFNKMKKTPLFKFDSSSHAMSLNAYLQEQKEAMKEKAERSGCNTMDSIDMSLNDTDQYLVCEPAAENIVVIFNPLMKFIFDIDDELNLEENNHCPLYSYLISCAKLFLNQMKIDLDRILDAANKSLDAWRIVSDTDLMNRLNQNRPILQSALIIEKASQDLKSLIFALPMFADEFLTFICNILSNYKETCSSAYRGIVQPESEDKRIISATWARDEDINRFLKDLPNWPSSQKSHHRDPYSKSLASIGTSMTFDESPEVIRLRNKKESEILASNLTQDTLIPSHEILSDVSQLKSLGQLQESLEWLSNHILSLSSSLTRSHNDHNLLSAQLQPHTNRPNPRGNFETVQLPDVSIAALNQLAREFEELAETCLLVLHLEVRVHCFYYLLRVTKGNFSPGVDAQEPDVEVVQLNKDLSSIDEALSLSLQQWKLKYVFEGVSHLVATILINSASSLDRINQNGVKKMCRNIFAIQQNLTSITMSREVALDYARQYFELFYSSPEEMLALIEERGPQFQTQEYINALELLHRSSPGRDINKLKANKQRLDEIMNEAAVSV